MTWFRGLSLVQWEALDLLPTPCHWFPPVPRSPMWSTNDCKDSSVSLDDELESLEASANSSLIHSLKRVANVFIETEFYLQMNETTYEHNLFKSISVDPVVVLGIIVLHFFQVSLPDEHDKVVKRNDNSLKFSIWQSVTPQNTWL